MKLEAFKLFLTTLGKFFDWRTNKDSAENYKSQSEYLSKSSNTLNRIQEEHRQELIELENSNKSKRNYMENDW